MKNLLSTALVVAAMSAPAGTNSVWDQTFPNLPTNALLVTQWMHRIEKESARVDPDGVGLRFVAKTALWNNPDEVPIQITGTNKLSFAQVLDALQCCAGVKFRKVDNMIVTGNHQFRYLLLAYSGRCVDVETKEPVTNLTIRAADSVFPMQFMTVDATGRFTCGVPHIFNFIALPDAVFTDDGFPFAKDVVTVSAPGYEDCTVTNDIWDWRRAWGGSSLSVDLRRKKETEVNKPSEATP